MLRVAHRVLLEGPRRMGRQRTLGWLQQVLRVHYSDCLTSAPRNLLRYAKGNEDRTPSAIQPAGDVEWKEEGKARESGGCPYKS